MEPSCSLGTTRCIPQNFPKSHIINPLLTKFVRSRWLDIGLVLFCEFMDLDFVSVHKHAKKELGQYPAILTSHLVNNPYVQHNKQYHMKVLLNSFHLNGHTLGFIHRLKSYNKVRRITYNGTRWKYCSKAFICMITHRVSSILTEFKIYGKPC